jgi:sporulation protein YlmC with PRC-barrel domain
MSWKVMYAAGIHRLRGKESAMNEEKEPPIGYPMAAGAAAETRIVGSGKRSATGPGPEIMAAGTLEGNDVLNLSGEKLGTLLDIMVDVPNGRIAYAVLARGGVMGMGDKLFAIPWSALTLDTDRKCFLLDIDLERLRNSAGFDKDNWPRTADPSWAVRVDGY